LFLHHISQETEDPFREDYGTYGARKLIKFRSHSFPVIEPEIALIWGVGFALKSPEEYGDQGNRTYNLRTPSVPSPSLEVAHKDDSGKRINERKREALKSDLIIYLQHCASPALLVGMLMVDFQNNSDRPMRCIRSITHAGGHRQLTGWCCNEYDRRGDIPTTYTTTTITTTSSMPPFSPRANTPRLPHMCMRGGEGSTMGMGFGKRRWT